MTRERIGFTIGSALVAVAVLVGLAWQGTRAQTPEPGQATPAAGQRTISVSGQGEASAAPDIALVSLGVHTDAQAAAAAITQNNTQMQAVINAIKQAGVAAQDIQTQAISLQPNYQNEANASNGTQRLVGYLADNSVQVRVRNLGQLGTLLDSAVQAGANRILNVGFDISNPRQVLDRARQAAWQDALHKAEQLARLSGGHLGEAISVNESSQTPRPMLAAAAVAPQGQVPVEPGSQVVDAQLQVTWLLLSGAATPAAGASPGATSTITTGIPSSATAMPLPVTPVATGTAAAP